MNQEEMTNRIENEIKEIHRQQISKLTHENIILSANLKGFREKAMELDDELAKMIQKNKELEQEIKKLKTPIQPQEDDEYED